MNDPENNLSPMNILIVDDTSANIDVLRKFMAESGYQISVAPNGEIALKIIQSSRPDLILLDIMMPGLDGFEVCKRLKEDNKTKDIPVIFVTAKTETADVVRGFNIGGVDYITKPFNREEVLSRVKTHLKIQALLQEQARLNKKLLDQNGELIESQNQYRIIIDKTSEGVFRLDPQGKIKNTNSQICSLLGFTAAELEDKPIAELIHAENITALLPQIATKRFGGRATSSLKIQFCVNEKSVLWKDHKNHSLWVDSFGIWNLPNNVLLDKGAEKTILGTLCVVKKLG